uniref:Uncharacterized protein n=1 Tax=Rhizophora mucronata TaxID=61149 RepID=A0A2P2NSZ1_RHIMU
MEIKVRKNGNERRS